jgi:phosphohistidine phosphatase SixA
LADRIRRALHTAADVHCTRAWQFALALLVACTASLAIGDDAGTLAGAALRDALLRGGYVLYFRHASTDFGQNDEQMSGYEDCARQRNLTERGRGEARAIGTAIRRLGVPIGEVLASPFCRTRETAELIFGRASPDVRVRGGPADDAARYAPLRTLLATPVGTGTNLVIVSHGNPFRAVVGPPYLADGEAAVIQPLGNERFRVVARIRPDAWDALR